MKVVVPEELRMAELAALAPAAGAKSVRAPGRKTNKAAVCRCAPAGNVPDNIILKQIFAAPCKMS